MKKHINILMTVAMSVGAVGILSAADFQTDLRLARQTLLSGAEFPQMEIPEPEAMMEPDGTPGKAGDRWWSVSFFGSGHKASTKAALKVINKKIFPDIDAAHEILKSGSNDESGHPNKEMNGGPVKEFWFGDTPFSKGGVLANYTQFKFDEAYTQLGVLCHLTQDQSVPVHVANIHHGINDSFENAPSHEVKIRARRPDSDREPYEYYQVLQNETRKRLPGWTDPATGKPYWELPADAPRFGRDVTYGAWGHYGGRKNRDTYAWREQDNDNSHGGGNNSEWVSARPEIRLGQLSASGEVTISVLESASERLPPLVRNFSVAPAQVSGIDGPRYQLKFDLLENRTPKVTLALYVYKDGELLGVARRGAATLFPAKDMERVFSGSLAFEWDATLNFSPLPPGTYTLDLRATDVDGNVTPDMVNADGMPENDTQRTIVIN